MLQITSIVTYGHLNAHTSEYIILSRFLDIAKQRTPKKVISSYSFSEIQLTLKILI